MIEFFVPGDPVPQARPRVTTRAGFAQTYTPAKSRHYGSYVRMVAATYAPAELLDQALKLTCCFVIQKPASKPRRCLHPATKPDLDNLVKAVKDALEGVLYTNDSRIVEIAARKVYGTPPGVQVQLEEV